MRKNYESRDALMKLLDDFIALSIYQHYSFDKIYCIGGLCTYVNEVKSLISMYVWSFSCQRFKHTNMFQLKYPWKRSTKADKPKH